MLYGGRAHCVGLNYNFFAVLRGRVRVVHVLEVLSLYWYKSTMQLYMVNTCTLCNYLFLFLTAFKCTKNILA